MIHSSPKNIALFNSIIISLIFAASYAAIYLIYENIAIEPGIYLTLLIFFFTFLTINYSINKFIYSRLKVIYRTIGKLRTQKMPQKKGKQIQKSSDVLDIVNQVVMEWSEEQKQEIEALKQGAKYRREFIGNLSHELKTPIFNIQGYISTLLDGGLEDQDVNRKFLQRSEKSINRMIALVDDLEYISKLESGELKLKPERFDLLQLTKEVFDFLEMKAEKTNTKLIISGSLARSVFVKADKKRIRQVLINLVDNAIKYTDKKNSKVNVVFYDFHDKYLVEVRDNGMG
ncbi:MAG: two-component sensor histidine kinase, partial [Marinilabiliales bacterium]